MSWSTRDELNFLRKIGTFGLKGAGRDPKKCLEGYIKAAKNRVDWGKIDKEVAVETAKALLRTHI